MKDIIEVISSAFNRGYVLGKSTADGGIISKHDLQNALKAEIEFACKKIQPHNKPEVTQQAVQADAEIDGICTCHWALNFKPRRCSTCGKRTA